MSAVCSVTVNALFLQSRMCIVFVDMVCVCVFGVCVCVSFGVCTEFNRVCLHFSILVQKSWPAVFLFCIELVVSYLSLTFFSLFLVFLSLSLSLSLSFPHNMSPLSPLVHSQAHFSRPQEVSKIICSHPAWSCCCTKWMVKRSILCIQCYLEGAGNSMTVLLEIMVITLYFSSNK